MLICIDVDYIVKDVSIDRTNKPYFGMLCKDN
jgi:hypothetical protein